MSAQFTITCEVSRVDGQWRIRLDIPDWLDKELKGCVFEPIDDATYHFWTGLLLEAIPVDKPKNDTKYSDWNGNDG